MKLSIEEKTNLHKLSEKANDLFEEVIDVSLPITLEQVRKYTEFKQVLGEIYQICPLVSKTYSLMYEVITHKKFLH